MAKRSLWRGAVSFGLLHVPVELYSAARENTLHLHFLDSRDFEPVGYERVNKRTGKSVDWAHIVKGYEYQKGKYVALSDADFKHANPRASETIDIDSFAKLGEISPLHFDQPYHLRPGKGGEKVYALLVQALQATQRAAVATFVMRGKQHLCVLLPDARALLLVTLRFAEEIAAPEALGSGKTGPKLKEAEVGMAKQLIEGMTRTWNPKRFHDTYRQDLMKRIKEKISKRQMHELAEEPKASKPRAEVIDLMDALKASLKLRSKASPRRAAATSSRSRKRA